MKNSHLYAGDEVVLEAGHVALWAITAYQQGGHCPPLGALRPRYTGVSEDENVKDIEVDHSLADGSTHCIVLSSGL